MIYAALAERKMDEKRDNYKYHWYEYVILIPLWVELFFASLVCLIYKSIFAPRGGAVGSSLGS